jgi:hypothetical protein
VKGDVNAGGDFVGRDKHVHLHVERSETDAAPISDEARQLYALLSDTWFTLNDLEDLAFSLGIDWDVLAGDEKTGKARALTRYCEARGMLPRLRRAVRMARPNLKDQLG